MEAQELELGIRLESVPGDQRFILGLAGARLLCALAACFLWGWMLSRSADVPIRWLVGELILLGMGAAFFFSAMKPLSYLTRHVEFYENAIVFHETTVPLDRLSLVVWQEGEFKALGLFRLSHLPERRMLCFMETQRGTKQKNGVKRVLRISELYYPNLLTAYEQSYEASLPTEFRREKKYPRIKKILGRFTQYFSKLTRRK